MDERHARALRCVRAVLLAGLVLSLAAGAHVVGGGDLPSPLLLALLATLSLAAGSALARRRLRRRTLVPALAAGQALLHQAFTALATVPGTTEPAGPAGHGGHAHGSVLVLTSTAGAPEVAVDPASGLMVLAHALAAAATALVAVAADRAWERAVAWAVRLFPALAVLLTGPVAGGGPRTRRTRARRTALPRSVVLSTQPRRGPPAGLLAAA
ncbi:hypothetical protein WDZ17_09410 [Pseudokineococcus basanitobsidens]|uniref:Integral membrane protein n=1 Tax=Pseudokineococcus basanitobsidens TaxID=1926649 RepID=A0ABU8RK76_9ACTN